MDDVVVVLPGIMGSTLWRNDVPLWEPSRGAIGEVLRSHLRSIRGLALAEGIGDEHPGDGVEARALMPDVRLPLGIWTFDLGYDALLNFLRRTFDLSEGAPGSDRPANLVPFPYDWRLSNRYNGALLRTVAGDALARWRDQGGRFADAKLVFIAHSMGGLVTRWYLDRLGGAEVTRKLITLGTPHRGSLKALEQLVNGVRKGPGPFKLNLTTFARSLPSLHQLMPEYACIEQPGNLAKTTEVEVPELTTAMVADAMEFHTQIDEGRRSKGSYQLHPVCGFKQPTWTTAAIDQGQVIARSTINGDDNGGDATVPRVGAAPVDIDLDSPVISHVADNHGGLVHNQGVFDAIEGVLTASQVRYRAGEINLAVEVDEVLEAGEALHIRATLPDDGRAALDAVIADENGRVLDTLRLRSADGAFVAQPTLPGPGLYQVTVQGAGAARHQVSPITTAVLAWPPERAVGDPA